MYIKRLSLEGVGRVGRITVDLKSDISDVEIRFADEVCFAVGVATANGSLKEKYPPVRADKRSSICAEVFVGGKRFTIRARGKNFDISAEADVHNEEYDSDTEEYLSLMKRCDVEDRLSLIDGKHRSPYHDLNVFLNEEKHFRPGELRRITDGIGTTRSFRSALKQYLLAETIAPEEKRGLLSRLDAVRFWDSFGKTRDMHYEGKPLLLVGLTDEEKKIVSGAAPLLDRQVIVITQPRP